MQCITNKTLRLEGLAVTYKPKILIFCETWLTLNNFDCIVIHGYYHANYFVREKRIHGGVSIFVEKSLPSAPCKQIDNLSIEYHCELASVVVNEPCKLLVIGMYRTGNGNFDIFIRTMAKLFDYLSELSTKNVILAGDWNVDFMTDSEERSSLIDIMQASGYRNLVEFYTRIYNGSKSAVDCFVTNIDNMQISLKSVTTGISDHFAQHGSFKVVNREIRKFVSIEKRFINNAKIIEFCNAMIAYDWNDIFKHYNMNTFDMFMNKYKWNFDLHFPLKTSRVRLKNQCPWISEEIIKQQREIHDLHEIIHQYPQLSIKHINNKKRHIYKCILENKMKHFQHRIKNSTNIKKEVWNIIKEETNKDIKDWN